MWLGFGNKEMELRLKYIEMLAKWGFRMSKINTIDGDSVEINKDSTKFTRGKTQIKDAQDKLKETDGVVEQIFRVTAASDD
jgi:hypothetical protein